MKLVPVAVFGELAQVGLQLIKILHGDGSFLTASYAEAYIRELGLRATHSLMPLPIQAYP